jgi:hypothetical protein
VKRPVTSSPPHLREQSGKCSLFFASRFNHISLVPCLVDFVLTAEGMFNKYFRFFKYINFQYLWTSLKTATSLLHSPYISLYNKGKFVPN